MAAGGSGYTSFVGEDGLASPRFFCAGSVPLPEAGLLIEGGDLRLIRETAR